MLTWRFCAHSVVTVKRHTTLKIIRFVSCNSKLLYDYFFTITHYFASCVEISMAKRNYGLLTKIGVMPMSDIDVEDTGTDDKMTNMKT